MLSTYSVSPDELACTAGAAPALAFFRPAIVKSLDCRCTLDTCYAPKCGGGGGGGGDERWGEVWWQGGGVWWGREKDVLVGREGCAGKRLKRERHG